MRIDRGTYESWEPPSTKTSLTLGVLDGVHAGHRALLRRAFGHDGLNAVVTFDPHPVEVLVPGSVPRLITTIEERARLLEEVGAELVSVLDLAEVRDFSPERFVEEILVGRLNVGSLTVGKDFQFGRDREGDVGFLESAGAEHGFIVDALDIVDREGAPVSSSRIRALIETGLVSDAARLLESRFTLTNEVVPGDRRGRDLGFPTANIRPVPRKVMPADGVYASLARIGEATHMAATNVGTRPTFGDGERLVEAHILDFEDDIYGEELSIEFVERLRPELAFDSVDELVETMANDVAEARRILASVMG